MTPRGNAIVVSKGSIRSTLNDKKTGTWSKSKWRQERQEFKGSGQSVNAGRQAHFNRQGISVALSSPPSNVVASSAGSPSFMAQGPARRQRSTDRQKRVDVLYMHVSCRAMLLALSTGLLSRCFRHPTCLPTFPSTRQEPELNGRFLSRILPFFDSQNGLVVGSYTVSTSPGSCETSGCFSRPAFLGALRGCGKADLPPSRSCKGQHFPSIGQLTICT